MTSMTHPLPSDMPGGCGFSVRTVYSCDDCGLQVDNLEKITEHLAQHNPEAKTIDHDGRLDPFTPHQQEIVTSPPCLPASVEINSRNVLGQQSVEQDKRQTARSKPMVCNVCGRIFKYLRCFKRHIEQEHKSLTQFSSDETVTELQDRGMNAVSKSRSGCKSNLSDCQQQHDIRHIDNPLSNTDYIELEEEVRDILDDVFSPASDEVKPQAALYCCPDCPQQFQSHHSLCLHIADKHSGWNLVCKWCGRLFQETDKLHSHIIGDHVQMIDECDTGSVDPILNPHHCSICSLRYRSKKELAKHMKSHNNFMPAFACSMCSGRYASKSGLNYHIRIVHSTDHPYVCELCGDRFASAQERIEHAKEHSAELCTVCGVRLRQMTCNDQDDDATTMCIVCYLEQLSSENGVQIVDEVEETAPAKQQANRLPLSHSCTVCGNQFARRGSLRRHERQYASDELHPYIRKKNHFQCTFCSRVFNHAKGVRRHIRSHIEQRVSSQPLTFSCKLCFQSFVWKGSLLRHMRTSHPASSAHDTPVISSSLSVVSVDQSVSSLSTSNPDIVKATSSQACDIDDLHSHIRENNHFQCTFCSRVFDNAKGMHRHIRAHIDQRVSSQPLPFSCKLCGQLFVWKGSLLRHMRTSHPASSTHNIPVVSSSLSVVSMDQSDDSLTTSNPETAETNSSQACDTCTQPAENKSTSSKNKVAIPCPECKAVFFWASNMRRHMREEHQGGKKSRRNASERLLQCTRCGRRFTRLFYLRTHLQAHVKADRNGGQLQSLLCSECGRMMSDTRQLRYHMLRHSGHRPHQCNQCSKSFYIRAHLNEHMSIVHGGNRIVCDQCGHKVNSRSALRAHCRSVHPSPEDEPNFQCSVCTRRYWTPAALRRHAEAHDPTRSAKRKAMCAICSILFRHVFNLADHIKTSHGDVYLLTPFACATCHEQFSSGQEFKTHYRSKHRTR